MFPDLGYRCPSLCLTMPPARSLCIRMQSVELSPRRNSNSTMEDIVSSASAVPIPVAQPSAVRDSQRWSHGDFALISSDHVRFRIPVCYMFAAR